LRVGEGSNRQSKLQNTFFIGASMTEKIRFANPVVFVKDIQVSKEFYRDVVGLKIVQDADVFILFEDHFSIHQARELVQTVFGSQNEDVNQPQGRNNLLLYFESDRLEDLFDRLSGQVRLIHPITAQAWGQKVFRFYDPDGHIVEFGEPMVFTF
jgi:catechol 2,3-dioxygenase-like lactoylglutathione lyase family enzyme